MWSSISLELLADGFEYETNMIMMGIPSVVEGFKWPTIVEKVGTEEIQSSSSVTFRTA